MEPETAELFSDAGFTISWQQKQLCNDLGVTDSVVWVRFHGNCRVQPGVWFPATSGPLASTLMQDGEIWPFIDMDCERAAAIVSQNLGTLSGPLVTRRFGRALGRILAHELYHYLTQSADHGGSELFSRVMSPQDLT
jgi:hypothetical protein